MGFENLSDQWLEWAIAVANLMDPFKNGRIAQMQKNPNLDATLDCQMNVSGFEFKIPEEIEQQVDQIIQEPLEKYISG